MKGKGGRDNGEGKKKRERLVVKDADSYNSLGKQLNFEGQREHDGQELHNYQTVISIKHLSG